MPNTVKHNDLLNSVFDDGRILSADLPELMRYLLACTEMREADILNPRVKEGLPKRTEFIKQLIRLKQAEKASVDFVATPTAKIVKSSTGMPLKLPADPKEQYEFLLDQAERFLRRRSVADRSLRQWRNRALDWLKHNAPNSGIF